MEKTPGEYQVAKFDVAGGYQATVVRTALKRFDVCETAKMIIFTGGGRRKADDELVGAACGVGGPAQGARSMRGRGAGTIP